MAEPYNRINDGRSFGRRAFLGAAGAGALAGGAAAGLFARNVVNMGWNAGGDYTGGSLLRAAGRRTLKNITGLGGLLAKKLGLRGHMRLGGLRF